MRFSHIILNLDSLKFCKSQMRVHARREPEFQASASYALQVTPAIIKEYEKFYKVDYPLEKLGNAQKHLANFNKRIISTETNNNFLIDGLKDSTNFV